MIAANHPDRKHFDGQATLAEPNIPPPTEGLRIVIGCKSATRVFEEFFVTFLFL